MSAVFDPIDDAIAAIARGEIVVIADDDEDRANRGEVVMAADAVTPEAIAFFDRHTSGVVRVGLTGERCDELDLAEGITVGVSAGDRSATLRALADPAVGASSFDRPGHVVALRARSGGVLKRIGHTEASVDLARLAGRAPLVCSANSTAATRPAAEPTRAASPTSTDWSSSRSPTSSATGTATRS